MKHSFYLKVLKKNHCLALLTCTNEVALACVLHRSLGGTSSRYAREDGVREEYSLIIFWCMFVL
jgi:hypothetical protein